MIINGMTVYNKCLIIDVIRIGHLDQTINHLQFECRFESGNLRRATQVLCVIECR